jgi:hypothetical protein
MASSRMLTSVLFVVVTILLFNFAGFYNYGKGIDAADCADDTSFRSVASYTLRELGATCPQNIKDTDFYALIGTALAALIVAGVAISVFRSTSLDTAIYQAATAGLIALFGTLIMDIGLIFNQLADLNFMLAILISAPLVIAWTYGLFDLVRGKD